MFSRAAKPTSYYRGTVRTRLVIELVMFLGLAAAFVFILTKKTSDKEFPKKPPEDQLLVDTIGLFRYESESTESYLKSIRDRYRIETMILTLPSLKDLGTIEEATTKIMSAWKVGERYGNRGILLVFANAEKEVKIEVSYELEDVFTDSFVGSAEDLQLRPYFRQGNPRTGLTAVMEEIEIRADIKKQHQYTEDTVRILDDKFASGGAGAVRNLKGASALEKQGPGGLSAYVISPGPSIFPDSALLDWKMQKNPNFQPGQTPGEAYEIMKAAFRARGDPRDVNFFAKQEGKPYEVLQDGSRAVIYFGENNDREYQPFLFAKTEEGWIFDYINQRRYIISGPGDHWGIGKGDHEYQRLFDQHSFYWWMAVDIPWPEEDLYRPEDDRRLVARILELERLTKENPDDFDSALELGRLGTILDRPPNVVIPSLERAKTLNPASPRPYFYAAAAYVIRVFQSNKAIQELRVLIQQDPGNLFGRNLLGYAFYLAKDYDSAIEQLSQALQIDPLSCYAAAYLGYASAERHKATHSPNDKQAALEALRISMVDACGPSMQRPWMLMVGLQNNGLLVPVVLGASGYWYNYQNDQGVVIYDVQRGKPADQAGLEPGDFIMSFNGQPVHQSWELTYLVAICYPGQRVKIEIVRGALDGPLRLGDGITVNPRTYGLNPPRELTLEAVIARKEPKE